MGYSALQEWCKTLTLRLDDAERRAERMEQAWLVERTRNEVWQLKDEMRQLQFELDKTRRLSVTPPVPALEARLTHVEQQLHTLDVQDSRVGVESWTDTIRRIVREVLREGR